MNNHEAKEVLLLYRSGTTDPNDPEFVEALVCAKQDPELGRWFQEHCAIYEALRTKFRQIPVPEGLKEQILSERKAQTASPVKRTLALAALCSVLLILVAGMAFWLLRPHEDKTFASFHNRMVRTVAGQYPRMDLETSDLKKIRECLAQKGGPADYVLPAALQKTTGTGCAVLQWQGKPVSMVCLNSRKSSDPKEPDLFLFVVNRAYVPKAPRAATPQFAQRSRFATASWSYGDKTYVLAGLGDEAFLRNYF